MKMPLGLEAAQFQIISLGGIWGPRLPSTGCRAEMGVGGPETRIRFNAAPEPTLDQGVRPGTHSRNSSDLAHLDRCLVTRDERLVERDETI